MDNGRSDKIKDVKCEDLYDMDRKDFELYIYSLRKMAENNVEFNRSLLTLQRVLPNVLKNTRCRIVLFLHLEYVWQIIRLCQSAL